MSLGVALALPQDMIILRYDKQAVKTLLWRYNHWAVETFSKLAYYQEISIRVNNAVQQSPSSQHADYCIDRR